MRRFKTYVLCGLLALGGITAAQRAGQVKSGVERTFSIADLTGNNSGRIVASSEYQVSITLPFEARNVGINASKQKALLATVDRSDGRLIYLDVLQPGGYASLNIRVNGKDGSPLVLKFTVELGKATSGVQTFTVGETPGSKASPVAAAPAPAGNATRAPRAAAPATRPATPLPAPVRPATPPQVAARAATPSAVRPVTPAAPAPRAATPTTPPARAAAAPVATPRAAAPIGANIPATPIGSTPRPTPPGAAATVGSDSEVYERTDHGFKLRVTVTRSGNGALINYAITNQTGDRATTYRLLPSQITLRGSMSPRVTPVSVPRNLALPLNQTVGGSVRLEGRGVSGVFMVPVATFDQAQSQGANRYLGVLIRL